MQENAAAGEHGDTRHRDEALRKIGWRSPSDPGPNDPPCTVYRYMQAHYFVALANMPVGSESYDKTEADAKVPPYACDLGFV